MTKDGLMLLQNGGVFGGLECPTIVIIVITTSYNLTASEQILTFFFLFTVVCNGFIELLITSEMIVAKNVKQWENINLLMKESRE